MGAPDDVEPGPGGEMIALDGVRKRLGGRNALDGLTLTVGAGEVAGLVGPLGAGKSTTLRILATLEQADEGTVVVGGIDVGEDPAGARRRVGYLPAEFGVYRRVTAFEYVEFFASLRRVPKVRRRPLAEQLLEVVGLADRAGTDVDRFDEADKRRLGLAQALVHDPAVLLLDEPLAALDEAVSDELRELVAELGHMGKAVVVTGHDAEAVARMATTVHHIEAGRIATDEVHVGGGDS